MCFSFVNELRRQTVEHSCGVYYTLTVNNVSPGAELFQKTL